MKKNILLILTITTLITNAQNFDWTPQTSGVTSALNEVFFVDSLIGWTVGDNGVILNTVNGGEVWTSQSSDITEILRSVFFINDTVGWAVGGLLNRALIKTTDGGENWVSLTGDGLSDHSNQLYDIEFLDAEIGWVITNDSIFRTSDGGETWINENYVSDTDVPRVRDIAITSDTTAYVAGSRKKTVTNTSAEIYYRRPENSPNLWSSSGFELSPISGGRFNDVEFINSDIGFTGGEKGRLYKKTDFSNAGPWELNFELQENQSIFSISFPTESYGMFNSTVEISGDIYSLVYHTSNSGVSWSESPDSIPGLILAKLHAPDSLHAWIVGVGGQIYKGVVAEENPPSSINHLGLNKDVKIYPNPASDVVNIEINTSNHYILNYSVSDITGRVIEHGLWSENSINTTYSLNISEFLNGVYFLTLTNETLQKSYRIIKN